MPCHATQHHETAFYQPPLVRQRNQNEPRSHEDHEEARRSDKNGVVDVSQSHGDRLFFGFSVFLRVLRAFVVKIIALEK